MDLRQLRGALGVDEVDLLEIEHERVCLPIVLGEFTDALLERLARGEKQTAIRTQHRDARERLVFGVLLEVAEHLRPDLAAQQRHRRAGCDVDQPPQREHDPDNHTSKHTGREHADDRGHRHPEVEAGHPVQTAQLGEIDHPEHDGVDDHRAQNRLREMREYGREHNQRRDHQRPGGERRDRRARPSGLVQRAG